tara:strand:+ start:146 stop:340 length:195 start_codon:yes stop_codon:yes gene_type:complete
MTTTEKQIRFDKLEGLRVIALMEVERLQSKLALATTEAEKDKLDVSIDWSWCIMEDAIEAQRNL